MLLSGRCCTCWHCPSFCLWSAALCPFTYDTFVNAFNSVTQCYYFNCSPTPRDRVLIHPCMFRTTNYSVQTSSLQPPVDEVICEWKNSHAGDNTVFTQFVFWLSTTYTTIPTQYKHMYESGLLFSLFQIVSKQYIFHFFVPRKVRKMCNCLSCPVITVLPVIYSHVSASHDYKRSDVIILRWCSAWWHSVFILCEDFERLPCIP